MKNQLGSTLHGNIQYQKTMEQVYKMLKQCLSETQRYHIQPTTFSNKKVQGELREYSIHKIYKIQPTKIKIKLKNLGIDKP